MKTALLASLLSLAAAPCAGVEFEPVYSLQFLGGQYFMDGERGSLTGDFSGRFTPAVILDERWTLMPAAALDYQGTKQVVDLVGAGTLFQERMDAGTGLKAVYRPEGSRWRWKPSVGVGMELLKETKDESWTSGLFDYKVADMGLEAEYVYKEPFSARLLYDYSYTWFPNYTSLESQLAYDFGGQSIARELVGDRILDVHMHMLQTAVSAPLRRNWVLDSSLTFQYQSFPNQSLVDASGELLSSKRRDFVTRFHAGLSVPYEYSPDLRFTGAVRLGALGSSSNQGSYDARNIRFLPGFYNYFELSVAPGLKASFGDVRQPIDLSLSLSWARRRYPHRPVQDASGTYLDETLSQQNWMIRTTFSYPMAPRLRLVFDLQRGWATSNQGFQQYYNYDYQATNYMIGFSYDY